MQTQTRPRLSQLRALRRLGLGRAERREFFYGKAVVFAFQTSSEPGIAFVQRVGSRLRTGIISIRDVGGGVGDLARFRELSRTVARTLGLTELELFGAAVVNRRLENLLVRRGFSRSTEQIPEALGGGTMEILSKVFSVE